MKSIGWDVIYRGKVIDTVFYDIDCDADYVRTSLISHDGYPDSIKIRRG